MGGKLLLELVGPNVRPETVDARASLSLAVALLEALEAVGRYEEISEEAPFFVTLTSLRGQSLDYGFEAVPRGNGGLEAFQQAAARIPLLLRQDGHIPKRLVRPLEKLRLATRGLPSHIVATARFGSVEVPLTDVARATAFPLLRSAETFRATVLRAGGVHPRVSLRFPGQTKPVTVDIAKALIEAPEFRLYREADVSGVFFRDLRSIGAPIVSGEVTELRFIRMNDPVDAFDAWYEAAGRPWSGVTNIEEELARGRE